MNYILHFQSKPPAQQPTKAEIKEYFQHRDNYTVNDYQALYSNEDTGIYFTFQFGGAANNVAGLPNILPVYFNIGSSKSHIFVLEAEPELAEFVKNFNLLVSDLQMKGSGYVEYTQVDFFRGWTAVSESSYLTLIANNPSQPFPSLPVAELEKCWHWNYHLRHLQGEIGQEVFVPKILVIDYLSNPTTAVVWTDAGSIALPKVDRVILYRKTGTLFKKHGDMAMVKENEVEPLLAGFPVDEEFYPYFTVIYKEIPPPIKNFFQAQKPVPPKELKFISYDEIHDREMIEKVLRETNTSAK
jgi:hypothetical protein